jgi:MFS family permease
MTLRSIAASDGMRAFRHRNYRLFYAGQTVSLIGTWMQSLAQGWLVLSLTGNPLYLGVIAAAQFTPVLLFGLFGGVLADAVPKRKTLIGTQTSMMALALVLWALTAAGVVQVWMILVLALLLGIANAVDMPVRQAFSVEMVGREDVGNAVALNSAMFNSARIIGPAIAGLTIGVAGIAVAFLLNGLSFIAVIVGLFLMRDAELRLPPPSPRPRTPRAVVDSLAEGLRYVRATPIVLLAIIVVGVVATFGMNFNVLVPAFTKDVLHADAAAYGFLMAASGIGSLVAALWIAFNASGSVRPLVGGALLLGVAEVALAAVGLMSVALALMFLVGIGGIAMTATANTAIQLAVPDVLRGRVISVYTTVFAGSTPIGGLVAGAIASGLGVPAAFIIGGGVSAVGALGAIAWLRFAGGHERIAPERARVMPAPDRRDAGRPTAVATGIAASGPVAVPEAVTRATTD